MLVNLASSSLPPTLRGMASVDLYGIPRFWPTIWIDVLKPTLEPSTSRKHLSALDRLYDAANRQRGGDCLDRLIAEADADALEDVHWDSSPNCATKRSSRVSTRPRPGRRP